MKGVVFYTSFLLGFVQKRDVKKIILVFLWRFLVNSILSYFKPAQSVVPIQNEEVVQESYHYWRLRVLYSMFFGYAFYYFTRKSFTFAIPGLIEELHFTKAQLGFLGSIFSIMYGLSKFTSGVLSDRSSPRYFMSLGLLLTGMVNICFGFSSSLIMFTIFWGLNGWFQGFGAPPCVRLLTQWYSHSERGSWWSIWSVSHNVGAFIIPWIVGLCLYYAGWRYAMFVPGIICIFASFFLLNRLRDNPQSLGLPPIEKFRNDYQDVLSNSSDQPECSSWQIFVDYILKNKYIWLLAIAYFFVYVVRTAVNDWTALFLLETKSYSQLGANGCVSLFEVGGFFGSLTAGWSSDKLFSAKRGPVNVIFAAGMILSIAAFWFIPPGYQLLDSIAMFFIGFCVFGPQMLVGVAAAELTHRRAVATSNGFVGCAAYIGSAVAGYPLGKITQDIGWEGFFLAVLICCIISMLVLLPMWGVTKKKLRSALTAAQ